MVKTPTTRRGFLGQTAAASLAVSGGIWGDALAQDEPYSDPEAADRWLAPWLYAPGAVSGALHMGRFADRMYYLDKPITWSPDLGQSGAPEVTVPKGFVTDLASIPRVFWSVLPTDGVYTFPAIVHDYLYWTQNPAIPRETADLILKYCMEDMKVDGVSVFAIYNAVRLRGGVAEGAGGFRLARRRTRPVGSGHTRRPRRTGCGRLPEAASGCFLDGKRVLAGPSCRAAPENFERQLKVDTASSSS